MTDKEKAKAYDEAIKRAKEWEGNPAAIDYIFPNLKESEDEVIRKQLICFLETEVVQCSARDKYIAWLEKQGELKASYTTLVEKPNGGIVREDFNGGDGFYKVELAYLSKLQVEEIERLVVTWQIPNYDKVEDCISNILADAPNDRFEDFKTNLRDCLNWISFSKLREWSDEDEERYNSCIACIRACSTGDGVDIANIEWLKSIRKKNKRRAI